MISFSLGGLFLFPRVATPLFVSYVLVLILSPLVTILTKVGFSRTTSAFFILIGVLFFTIYPIVKLVPIVSKEVQNIQYYIPKVENYIQVKSNYLQNMVYENIGYKIEYNYVSKITGYVRETISSILLDLPNFLASFVEWVFIIPLFIFFMLKDMPSFKRKVLSMIPNSFFEKLYSLFFQFNKQLGDYILAKFIEASILGVITTCGLLILDIRFALLFGIIAGVTNVIPYLGPVLGTVPVIVFSLAEYGWGSELGAVAILFLVANAIDLALIFPILVSKIVDLHPMIVVASVIIGSQLLGTVGMVVSIPVAAAIKLIFQEIFEEVYNT